MEQSIWLNKHITINNKIINWESWKSVGILYINDIINPSDGNFLSHEILQKKININTNYIETLQIQSSIPKTWTKKLKQHIYNTPINNIQNCIFINKSKRELVEIKCKDYYWHLINNITHTPKAIIAWENIYTNFKFKDKDFWQTIFKMPFICSRHTSIQAFQYKIIHRTLPCNEWLKNIKIKPDSNCTYCNITDSITHFLIDCKSNTFFWKSWAKWWQSMTRFNIRGESHIHESILFGFPGGSDNAIVTNYCLLYAKQYIYLKKLKESNNDKTLYIDFLGYLSQLKYILKIEKSICIRRNQSVKFDKFNFIYDNL